MALPSAGCSDTLPAGACFPAACWQNDYASLCMKTCGRCGEGMQGRSRVGQGLQPLLDRHGDVRLVRQMRSLAASALARRVLLRVAPEDVRQMR